MKVIDKRTERNNDWNVGDVICYWNKPDEKYYGLICEIWWGLFMPDWIYAALLLAILALIILLAGEL